MSAQSRIHPLGRPVWVSLTTRLAALAEGGALARRFVRDVNLFASARDDSPSALAALADLVGADDTVIVLQVPDVVIPPGLTLAEAATGVQMLRIAPRDGAVPGDDIVQLGAADAAEMLALAQLTRPGPFLTGTYRMGRFLGIRIEGRLAAMAGERMRLPGYTEVSGVCTHPDFRGLGLARRLSQAVAAGIEARGEQPFLHAWKSNTAAISLYAALGFELRSEVKVALLRRHGSENRPQKE